MPAPVSQQAPLLQPQALGASGQQVPPATQSAEHLQPYVPVPPQVPAQEPWIWQAGMTLLPCGVHAVPGGQVLMVAQSPGLPDAMLFKQAVAETPLQPAVKSRFCTSAPLHWYSEPMTALPHEVPAGRICCAAVSQHTPLAQQPGLSLSAHKPTLVLHVPILHATPLSLQSASLWQHPG